MANNQIIEFGGTFCFFELFTYTSGQQGIKLIDSIDGTTHLVISIDPYDYNIEKDKIIIKSYGNCIGIDKVLVDNNIVQDTGKVVKHEERICRIVKLK